jgi:protein-disulfide isomerase
MRWRRALLVIHSECRYYDGGFSLKTQSRLSNLLAAILVGSFLAGCAPSAPQIKKVLEDNPDILYSVIQKNPKKFLDVVQEAAQKARAQEEAKFQEDEAKAREDEMKNPKVPVLSDNRAAVGPKDAPVTIIEYSDFQCPFCRRGHSTMDQVLKAYDGKVRLVFKDFPIDRIHPMALPASKMYEAIALQDKNKATAFKNYVFEHQDDLVQNGAKFIDEAAKKVGANVPKAKKDAEGDEVKKVIDADRAEAEKFGFSGTPGYLVNGVSLKGAYPFEDFKALIEKQLAKK